MGLYAPIFPHLDVGVHGMGLIIRCTPVGGSAQMETGAPGTPRHPHTMANASSIQTCPAPGADKSPNCWTTPPQHGRITHNLRGLWRSGKRNDCRVARRQPTSLWLLRYKSQVKSFDAKKQPPNRHLADWHWHPGSYGILVAGDHVCHRNQRAGKRFNSRGDLAVWDWYPGVVRFLVARHSLPGWDRNHRRESSSLSGTATHPGWRWRGSRRNFP